MSLKVTGSKPITILAAALSYFMSSRKVYNKSKIRPYLRIPNNTYIFYLGDRLKKIL
jgi:hypothetical protein